MKEEIDNKAIINRLLTGYSYLICNPINHEQLKKENPNVTYNVSKYVKENEIICLNDWELVK